MKVIAAPQTFKGTYSAFEAADAIAEGVLEVFPDAEIILQPVADGGDGTLDILIEYGIIPCQKIVSGPLGEPIDAKWGVTPDGNTALIESAQACGLALLSPERLDPLHATTYGVGQLIKEALDRGFRNIVIGLGGSATTDGGKGLADALGVTFNGCIDLSGIDHRLEETRLIVACDVTNTFFDAANIYAQQKGASPEIVHQLQNRLQKYAEMIFRDLKIDITQMKFGGAAGGAAAGLVAFFHAELVSGAEFFLDAMQFDALLEDADLVIIGEGCLDSQTLYHKVPLSVAKRAMAKGVHVFAVAGKLGAGWEQILNEGVSHVVSCDGKSLQETVSTMMHRLINLS